MVLPLYCNGFIFTQSHRLEHFCKAWPNLCQMLPLGRYRKMIAVSREHRLAVKKCINIEDLYGETLMMVKKGNSGVNDLLRNDLEQHHPQIRIEDTPHFYDLSVFNRCAETKNVLLSKNYTDYCRRVEPITVPHFLRRYFNQAI